MKNREIKFYYTNFLEDKVKLQKISGWASEGLETDCGFMLYHVSVSGFLIDRF